MKILLLTSHLDMGGISMYIVNLSRYLKKLGHEVVVVSGGGSLEEKLASNGINSVVMDIRTKFEFGLKTWKALLPLKKLIEAEGIDIVHSQTRVTNVIGSLLDLFTGVPHVATCHGSFKHKRLSRRVFPCWGRQTVAISSSVAEHLTRDLGVAAGNVHRIYNGIETDKYSSKTPGLSARDLRNDIGLDDRRPVIGTVGRISPVKGHRYLIDAFDILIKKGVDAQLLIVGNGPDEGTLKKLAARLPAADRIFIDPGKAAIVDYLSIFDVYCMPSVDEGFGLSLVEAMAAGRPCVASDIGGLSEIITDGIDGLLVPACDPGALAKAVKRLLEDPVLRERIASAGRERALKDFNIEKCVSGTVEVYEKAVSEAYLRQRSRRKG